MNPFSLMKLKPLFEQFCQDHPKLLMFFAAAGGEVDVDSVLEVTLRTSAGKTMKTNIKINPNDAALMGEMKNILEKNK